MVRVLSDSMGRAMVSRRLSLLVLFVIWFKMSAT